MRPSQKALSTFLLFSTLLHSNQCFTTQPLSFHRPATTITSPSKTNINTQLHSTASRVQDDDGPTPTIQPDEPEELTESEVSELLDYDPSLHPIPYQPWRRGDTDGCQDPIDSPWRIEAEELVRNAVFATGARVKDVTWYMAAMVVTLVEDTVPNANQVAPDTISGTAVEVRVTESRPPQYFDPDDVEPEDDYGIYEGEEDGRILSNTDGTEVEIPNDPYVEREFDEVSGTYLPAPERPARDSAVRNMSDEEWETYISNGMDVKMIDRDERVKNKLSMEDFAAQLEALRSETSYTEEEMEVRAKGLRARYLNSDDLAEFYPEEFELVGREEALQEKLAMPVLERADGVDTYALEIISKSILDALEDEEVEERLKILSRHELILTCEGDEEVYVESQRQFDQRRGKSVLVQTQDPFGSNRVLEGTLVDRNALDVVVNMKGRMVTVPMNMVAYVKIPGAGDTSEDDEEYEE